MDATMTIRVKQLGSQALRLGTKEETHELEFDAWDPSTRWPDMASLYLAVSAFAPQTYLGLAPTNISGDLHEDNGHATFTITYGSGEPPEATLRVSFDSTGGQVRATTSLATTSYPTSGRTAPDFKHAVEVKGGQPEGVDITIPALRLVFTYKWPKGVITINDAKFIAGLTGRTNNGDWYGFKQGELLFLGATGEIDLVTPTEIQYNFAASSNRDISIGSWITGISKRGHQHLWVYFEDVEDTTAKKLVQRPLAAYVETMYPEADFSQFGIGS